MWLITSDRELVQARELDRRPLSWSELLTQLEASLPRRLAEAKVGLLVHFASSGVAVLDGTSGTATNPVLWTWRTILPGDPRPWSYKTVPGVARLWVAALCRALQEGTDPAKKPWEELAKRGLVDARLHDTFGMQLDEKDRRLRLPTALIRKLRGLARKSFGDEIQQAHSAKALQCQLICGEKDPVRDALAKSISKGKGRWDWFVAKFGDAEVPDFGGEIASLLAIRQQVRSYVDEHATRDKPLNLLVVGPPGAGKSFIVKGLIRSVPGLEKAEVFTVNLTQIRSEQEIFPAFEQLRTERIKGKLGVLFFDEFDTSRDGQELGWLSYFLAPMNDGEYATPGGARPLGRCILVFAGGTVRTRDELESWGDDKTRKARKVPDFASRIHAAHEVVSFDSVEDKTERRVRLAMLLFSLLKKLWPNVRQVDDDLLDALMGFDYIHGARSVTSVVASLQGHGKVLLGRSDLPPDAVLDLHRRRTSA
ncbi:MAG: AAA family ATPase [Sandaracinaceae bacterium]|nr:AAA family ATPase [Sandaracinaceae bacterium]